MPKVRLYIEFGRQSAEETVEIPDGEWGAMTESQREAELDGLYAVHVANHTSGGATVLDEDGSP